jgi:hypothetical protein
MKKPQKSLKNWTDEKWGTKSGKPSTQGSKATGERYLPKKARELFQPKSMQQPQLRNVKTLKRVSSFPLNQRRLQQRLKGTDHDRETTNLS